MPEDQPKLPENAPLLPAVPQEEQPWLLDESHYPIREDLVEQVRARSFCESGKKRFIHSGKILMRELRSDEERCEAICMCLVMGVHTKLIARKFEISPKSVMRIREAMQDRGELAPVRLRVMRQLDQFIELGLEHMIDGVLTGKIAPGQIPIPVMCAIDKKGQLEAGIVPGTERTETEVSVESLKATWEQMKQARVTDVQSIVNPSNPSEIVNLSQLDTTLDTTRTGPGTAGGQADAAGLDLGAKGGEGGSKSAGGAENGEGLGREI